MVVGIDASGVAVGEGDLDGVVPYLCSGGRARFRLEHGKGGRSEGGRRFRERAFLVAFVVASGAGAVVAQIDEVEMRGVTVCPGDVYAGVGGDVNFDAGGFTAGMEGNGHGRGSRQSLVRDKTNDNAESRSAQNRLTNARTEAKVLR